VDDSDLAAYIGRPEEAKVRVRKYDALHPPRPVARRSDHHNGRDRKGQDPLESTFHEAMRKIYVE